MQDELVSIGPKIEEKAKVCISVQLLRLFVAELRLIRQFIKCWQLIDIIVIILFV